MATLVNNSTGSFTSAATWSLIDSTSFQNTETNSTATTTAFVSSQNFTPGAITIDGIGVKILTKSGAPAGTFSVRLFNATAAAAVAGTTVTINVTDIPVVNGSMNNGWIFMKFTTSVTLLAATNYNVQVTSSTNAQVTLYRSATAGDWSRFLRTTTTQAPASTDTLFVCGQYVSAGVNSTFTVTMNNADAGATTFGAIEIATKGILSSGVAAATNYYLKIAGNLTIYTDGTYQQGTVGTPVPSTSTSKLEFANTSNVQFGIEARIGGTLKSGGNPITNSAFLAADAAAAATSLTTNVSTGWLSGDVIALASTTRTRTESESKALTANASGTTLTITALTNAHSGTSPTQGELINLTRNVQIFGTSTTNQAYINITSTAIVDLQATEFFQLGSATATKRGIDVGTTTGSFTMNNCSLHDYAVANSIGIFFNSGAGNNFTFTNNVIYNSAGRGLLTTATSGTTYTINNNISILTGAIGFEIADLGGTTISNLTGISATGAGIQLSDSTASTTNIFATMSNFTGHANSASGVLLTAITGVTNNPISLISNITVWRNNTFGLILSNTFTLMIDTVNLFGNTTGNIQFNATESDNIYFKNVTSNAGVTLTSPIGIQMNTDAHEVYFDTSTFGVTTAHATGDVSVNLNTFSRLTFRNCLLSSTTPVATPGNMTEGSFLKFAKFQQTSRNHKTFMKYGTVTSDSVIFNSGPLSSRLTPNNADSREKLQGGVRKIAVPNGQTVNIKVFLRKSVVGDGAAYNGNQPRLILKADPAAGVTSDTVLATADNTYNGVFKALTATTPAITDDAVFQVYLDCDGTTGWVNTDDWSIVYP